MFVALSKSLSVQAFHASLGPGSYPSVAELLSEGVDVGVGDSWMFVRATDQTTYTIAANRATVSTIKNARKELLMKQL